uniref:Uncharacterized protein n=2 Tax=unclassified Prevotella TaxID=2638335 RepID=A0AB33JPQ3_9BACT
MRKNILLSFLFATVALLWTNSAQANIYVAGKSYSTTQSITGPGISGKVHYNAQTKTLTLENAHISHTGTVVDNFDNGLSIIVKGDCSITMNNPKNFFAALSTSNSMTIKGEGTLTVTSPGTAITPVFGNNITVTIDGCTLIANGGTSGINSSNKHKLHIRNATVKATGKNTGSIRGWAEITLENCKLLTPIDATIGAYSGAKAVVKGGTVVKSEVEIVPKSNLIINGIDQPNTETEATVTAIYSVDGRQLSKMQRGLNIVKMSDGTTKKVIR